MTTTTKANSNSNAFPLPAEMAAWISTFFGSTARKGLWAIGDQAVVSGTNFFCTVIVGRWCGLNELGLYSLAFGVLVLMGVFQHSLVLNPYAVFSNRLSGQRKAGYFGSVLVQQGLFMGIGVLALISIAFVTSYVVNFASLAQVFCVLAFAMPLFSLREFIRRILLAQLNVRATLVLDVSVAAIQIGGFLILGMTNLLSATSAYMAVATACGVPSIGWFVFTKTSFTIRWQNTWKTIGRHWSFGRWICASQFADVVQTYSLHWLLVILVGVTATGVYAAYSSIVMIFNPFILAIGGILLPRAAQVHHEGGIKELRRIVRKATIVIGIVMAVICAPVAIFGDMVVQRLYELGTAAEMRVLMIVLSATALIGTLSLAADNGLCVLERPKLNFISGLSGLVVTCVASPILALWWGIEGAALGALIAVTIASAIQLLGFLRLSRSDLRQGANA